MSISAEQSAESRKQYARFEGRVDETRLRRVLRRFGRKIDRLSVNPPASLTAVWDEVKLMGGLLHDYTRGEYTAVPWKVITALGGAVIYFVTPFDAIFDYIPVTGFLDDAMILGMALEYARDDLRRYARWKYGTDEPAPEAQGGREPAGERPGGQAGAGEGF